MIKDEQPHPALWGLAGELGRRRPQLHLPLAIVLSAAVLALALPATAERPARALPSCAPPDAAPARTCPALFGSTVDRSEARLLRKQAVLEVDASGDDVHLIHRGPWTAVTPPPDGLALLAAAAGPGCVPAGVVLVPPGTDGCAPGEYAVQRDDHLGSSLILAVTEGALVLAEGDELHLLAAAGAAPRLLRVSWTAPWTMPRPRYEKTPAPAPKKATPPGRKTRGR